MYVLQDEKEQSKTCDVFDQYVMTFTICHHCQCMDWCVLPEWQPALEQICEACFDYYAEEVFFICVIKQQEEEQEQQEEDL